MASPEPTTPTESQTAPSSPAVETTPTHTETTPAAPATPSVPAAVTNPAAPPADPASQPTYSAISAQPIFYFNKGAQVYVPLSVITFIGGRANIPAEINGIASTDKDPLGYFINHLVKVGKIKQGPLLPAPATKA
jgi:hypothetical protein